MLDPKLPDLKDYINAETVERLQALQAGLAKAREEAQRARALRDDVKARIQRIQLRQDAPDPARALAVLRGEVLEPLPRPKNPDPTQGLSAAELGAALHKVEADVRNAENAVREMEGNLRRGLLEALRSEGMERLAAAYLEDARGVAGKAMIMSVLSAFLGEHGHRYLLPDGGGQAWGKLLLPGAELEALREAGSHHGQYVGPILFSGDDVRRSGVSSVVRDAVMALIGEWPFQREHF